MEDENKGATRFKKAKYPWQVKRSKSQETQETTVQEASVNASSVFGSSSLVEPGSMDTSDSLCDNETMQCVIDHQKNASVSDSSTNFYNAHGEIESVTTSPVAQQHGVKRYRPTTTENEGDDVSDERINSFKSKKIRTTAHLPNSEEGRTHAAGIKETITEENCNSNKTIAGHRESLRACDDDDDDDSRVQMSASDFPFNASVPKNSVPKTLLHNDRWQSQHIASAMVDNAINSTLEEIHGGALRSPSNSTRWSPRQQRVVDEGVDVAIQNRGLRTQLPGMSVGSSGMSHRPSVVLHYAGGPSVGRARDEFTGSTAAASAEARPPAAAKHKIRINMLREALSKCQSKPELDSHQNDSNSKSIDQEPVVNLADTNCFSGNRGSDSTGTGTPLQDNCISSNSSELKQIVTAVAVQSSKNSNSFMQGVDAAATGNTSAIDRCSVGTSGSRQHYNRNQDSSICSLVANTARSSQAADSTSGQENCVNSKLEPGSATDHCSAPTAAAAVASIPSPSFILDQAVNAAIMEKGLQF